MENLDNFLVKVDEIKEKAKDEVASRDHRMDVTAIHGRYLGPKGVLSNALKEFVAQNDTESDLSKHAIKQARDEISTICIDRVKFLTKLEQDD